MKGSFKTAKKTARGSAPGYDALIMGCARKANCDRIDSFKVGHFRATAPDLESRIWRARSARLPDDASPKFTGTFKRKGPKSEPDHSQAVRTIRRYSLEATIHGADFSQGRSDADWRREISPSTKGDQD